MLGPDGPLSRQDFVAVATVIAPYLEKAGLLKGLVIYAKSFPGWDSFAALSSHLRFVKEHHQKISRVAFASNSVVGNFAETVACHFVNAAIKDFSSQELGQDQELEAGHQEK